MTVSVSGREVGRRETRLSFENWSNIKDERQNNTTNRTKTLWGLKHGDELQKTNVRFLSFKLTNQSTNDRVHFYKIILYRKYDLIKYSGDRLTYQKFKRMSFLWWNITWVVSFCVCGVCVYVSVCVILLVKYFVVTGKNQAT